VASQWKDQNFDSLQLPHFSTDFNKKTQNKQRYLVYDPTGKIWLMWDDGKGVYVGRTFSVTFCVLSIYLSVRPCCFSVSLSPATERYVYDTCEKPSRRFLFASE